MELVGPLILLTLLVPLVSLQVELIRARDPRAEFKRVGVVVVRTTAFDEMSEVIGRYLDGDIFASVVFRGIRYEYVGVAPPRYMEVMHGRELLLKPGLLYVAR